MSSEECGQQTTDWNFLSSATCAQPRDRRRTGPIQRTARLVSLFLNVYDDKRAFDICIGYSQGFRLATSTVKLVASGDYSRRSIAASVRYMHRVNW